MKIENNNQEIEILEDSITIKSKNVENHTIKELEQKIINYLYSLDSYDEIDTDLIRIILINK